METDSLIQINECVKVKTNRSQVYMERNPEKIKRVKNGGLFVCHRNIIDRFFSKLFIQHIVHVLFRKLFGEQIGGIS